MNRVGCGIFIIGLSLVCQAALSSETRQGFKSLRYDEDYNFLSDPALRTDPWDSVKYVPLRDGRAGYLSLGGEMRLRFESYENEFFSTQRAADNAYLLQRYLLHADYHASERFRIFGQLQSAFEDGRSGAPRVTDENELDLHQLFADVTLHESLIFRFGRQEMLYGSERLVSVREGTNNRRAFDAVRLLYRQDDTSVDVFFGSPVEVDPGVFDDQDVDGLRFWGIYATTPFPAMGDAKVDLYYLGIRNRSARFDLGEGREERHTVGIRLFGKNGNWDFNHEALYQFGSFKGGDIRAWSAATDHGYTWTDVWWSPRLGVKAAIATGDRNPNNRDLQTFNPLFPRGNYFTEASLLGPQNFIDIRPCLLLQPTENLSFEIGCDFYWRQSKDDGIYTPGGAVIYRGNTGSSRFVGTDLSLTMGWKVSRNFGISASYSHFFAGPFIRQNGGEDVNFGMLSAAYKF